MKEKKQPGCFVSNVKTIYFVSSLPQLRQILKESLQAQDLNFVMWHLSALKSRLYDIYTNVHETPEARTEAQKLLAGIDYFIEEVQKEF